MLGFVGAWLAVGFSFRRQPAKVPLASEEYCTGLAVPFVWLCAAIAVVFLTGMIFLDWLGIESGFWAIWQLLWILSVTAVFWVLPFLGVSIAFWGYAGRLTAGYTSRTIRLCNACLLALLLDAGLYFASALSMASGSNAS